MRNDSESSRRRRDLAVCRVRRDAKPAAFAAAWLGDHPLTHGQRGELSGLEIFSQPRQELLLGAEDGIRSDTVYSRRPFPSVTPYPCPGNYQDGRVVDKVEQVIEATIRIIVRPLVQLGLDSQYLHLGPLGLRPQHVGIHRRSPAIPVPTLRTRCRPSPCDRLSRPRTTTTAPPRPGPISRRRTCPHPTWMVGSRDQPETLPTFTTYRSTESVPNFAPAASPRVRRSSSSWPPSRRLQTAQESPAHPERLSGRAPPSGPHPPGWSRCIS